MIRVHNNITEKSIQERLESMKNSDDIYDLKIEETFIDGEGQTLTMEFKRENKESDIE